MTQHTLILYGIPNCDTVKKARQWLTDHNIAYHFHDFRKDGLSEQHVQRWLDALGLDTLLNRKGTTWRQLPETLRNTVDASNAVQLLQAHPTLIKRPVLETGTQVICGFKPSIYQQWLC